MNPLVQPDPGLYIWTILRLPRAGVAAGEVRLAAVARRAGGAAGSDSAIARRTPTRPSRSSRGCSRSRAKILAEARKEADQIISRTRADATRVGEEMKVKARADAENIVKNAERQISLETLRAIEKIRHEAIDLSVAIASKLLRRNLSREDNERLIAETFKEIEGTRRPN